MEINLLAQELNVKIYTFDNKILALNNKWLKEVDAPTGFVMNASNVVATYDDPGYVGTAIWQSPSEGYNGDGKTITLKVNEELNILSWRLEYGALTNEIEYNCPRAASFYFGDSGNVTPAGIYTDTMLSNTSALYKGSYLRLTFSTYSSSLLLSDIISKFELTIIDP